MYACDDDGPVHSGNAIVSRWPILRTAWKPLPAAGEPDERRTVVFAEIDGPRGPIQLFCTHLNWRFDHSAVRVEQVRTVAELIEECRPREYPPILCGDMNAAPDSDEIRMLTGRATVTAPKLVFHDAWEVAGEGAGMTWSNDNPYAALDLEPARRIDYVLAGWPKSGVAATWSARRSSVPTRSTAWCRPITTECWQSCGTSQASIEPMSSRMRAGGRCCSVITTPNGASASSIALHSVGGDTIMPPSPTPRKLTSGSRGTVSR